MAAVAVFLAFMLAPLDNAARWIGYVAIVVAALAVVMTLRFAIRPPVVLRLDDEEYYSRTRTVGGLFSGRWLDVEDVTVSDDVLVFSLAGSGEQRMPLGFFGRERMRLLRDVHDHLNAANGYRRFDV